MPKAKEEMHPIRVCLLFFLPRSKSMNILFTWHTQHFFFISLQAMNIFCQIPDEDVIFLDMDPKVGGRSSW